MKLRELGEIRNGNTIIVPCMGKNKDGGEHCCGSIRIPFEPPLPGHQLGPPVVGNYYWKRASGETIDDITLEQSIQAHECGHFLIKQGELTVVP